MKNALFISISILTSQAMVAQTLQDAIKKTDNEQYESATTDFKALIAKESTKGDNYFYFAENYFKRGDLDSANMYYQKGTEINPTYPLNFVGLGKVLWYKGKQADAKTAIFKAATLGANKNTEVMRKTAEIYINAEQKSLNDAISLLNAAIKIEPKNAENYILMGDAELEKNPSDGGPAIKNYNKAIELDPKSAKGVLRTGRLYQRAQNYQLALELYKKAEGIEPNYAPAYREKAELYNMAKQSPKAIESYRKYLELNNSPSARKRYAEFLYTGKQYQEAVTEIEALQKAGNTNFYLDRVLGHSYAELGNKTDKDAYTKGLAAMDRFFTKAGSNFKYQAIDFKYKGLLLGKSGKDSLGIIELEKAATMDPKMANEITREVIKTNMAAKKYSKAISGYEKLMGSDKKNLTKQDWYDWGRAYFYEAGLKIKDKKEAEAPALFVKADTCFSNLCQLDNTYPMGYFWRGRVNNQLDPKDEKGLAKPHFEAALTKVKPEEKVTYKTNIIEASSYLGSHFAFSKEKDLTKAKEYFKTVQELDPTNKAATDFFKSPAGK